jgi:hypothetical protein
MNEVTLGTEQGRRFRAMLAGFLAEPRKDTLMPLVRLVANDFLPRSADGDESPVPVSIASELKVEACRQLFVPSSETHIEQVARLALYLLGRVFPADTPLPVTIASAPGLTDEGERALSRQLWSLCRAREIDFGTDDLCQLLELIGRILVRCGFQPAVVFPVDRPLDDDALLDLQVLHLLCRRPQGISERQLRYFAENDALVDAVFHHWSWLTEIDWCQPPTPDELAALLPFRCQPNLTSIEWGSRDPEETAVYWRTESSDHNGNSDDSATSARERQSSNGAPKESPHESNGSGSRAGQGTPRLHLRPIGTEFCGPEEATKTSTCVTAEHLHRFPTTAAPRLVGGQTLQAFYRRIEALWATGDIPRTQYEAAFTLDVRVPGLNLGRGRDLLPLKLRDFDGKEFLPEGFGPRQASQKQEAKGLIIMLDPRGFQPDGDVAARDDAAWVERNIGQQRLMKDQPVAIVIPKIDLQLTEAELRGLGRTHLLPLASDPRLLAGYATASVGRLRGHPLDRLRGAALEFRGNNRFPTVQRLVDKLFTHYGSFLTELTQVTCRIQVFLTMTNSPKASGWQHPYGVEEIFTWLAGQYAVTLRDQFPRILANEETHLRNELGQLREHLARLERLHRRRRRLEAKKERAIGTHPLLPWNRLEAIDKQLADSDKALNEILTVAEGSLDCKPTADASAADREKLLADWDRELKSRLTVLQQLEQELGFGTGEAKFWAARFRSQH